jgi:hypothetical protein
VLPLPEASICPREKVDGSIQGEEAANIVSADTDANGRVGDNGALESDVASMDAELPTQKNTLQTWVSLVRTISEFTAVEKALPVIKMN